MALKRKHQPLDMIRRDLSDDFYVVSARGGGLYVKRASTDLTVAWFPTYDQAKAYAESEDVQKQARKEIDKKLKSKSKTGNGRA